MDITRIYNYYPGVVLSDLSDLFSEDTMANGNKLCVISYLSKALLAETALLHYRTLNYLVPPASNNSIYDIGINNNPEMESLILSETMEYPGRLKNFGFCQFPVSSLVRRRLGNNVAIR